jgi:uncharacterized repeat protein (TIGR01451 family)
MEFKRFFQILFFLPVLCFLSFSLLNAEISEKTVCVVLEGEVACFQIDNDYTSFMSSDKLRTGIFNEISGQDTAVVSLDKNNVLCFVPEKFQNRIVEKLKSGVWILLFKNIRKEKNTEWDIISVGEVVKEGRSFSDGSTMWLNPSGAPIIPEMPKMMNYGDADADTDVYNNVTDEFVKLQGDGAGTPPAPPPTPAVPPSEPTPPRPSGGGGGGPLSWPASVLLVNNTGSATTVILNGTFGGVVYSNVSFNAGIGSDIAANNGSNEQPWATVTYALTRASNGNTVYLLPATYSVTNGETLPLNMVSGVTIQGQDTMAVIDGEYAGDPLVSKRCINFNGVNNASLSTIRITRGYHINEGGGIYCNNSNNISISNCTIDNCDGGALGGGGICIDGSGSVNISNCTFDTITSQGGATAPGTCLRVGQPGVTITASASIDGSRFTNSTSANPHNAPGIIFVNTTGTTTITNSIIKNNAEPGIYCQTGTTLPAINNCSFLNNTGLSGSGVAEDYVYDNTLAKYYNINGGAPYSTMEGVFGTGNTTAIPGDPPVTVRVYDSVTGETIPSPVIAIYAIGSTTELQKSTSNPCTFNVDPGKYYIAVSKDGYAYPSQVISNVKSGDHGDIFTVEAGVPYSIDIPVDSDGRLIIEKTCNKKRVEVGDIVTYNIKIENKSWYKSIENVQLVDQLINGFNYADGSTYVGSGTNLKSRTADPVLSGRNLLFNIGTVTPNSITNYSYQVRVGAGIPPGRYKAAAYTRKSTTNELNSNTSKTDIEVIDDPLFTKGTIMGKVFWDSNKNTMQDQDELGIPNVKIYTEYGVVVETDEDGKYHIADVPAGNHLLKIDSSGFPPGIKFTTDNPYYVKITEGLPAKVNFGISEGSEQLSVQQVKEKETQPRKKIVDKFFIVALGDGTLRNLSTSGNIEMAGKDERFDDGIQVDGRIAMYLTGKVLGKYLITASVDSERRNGGRYDTEKLFTNLDPDKYYPVYGDASKVDYRGVDTQDVAYVLIEWDRSFAKWGSFNTGFPLYNRTLSGGVINYESVKKTKFGDPYTIVKAFGAYSRQKPAHDEFVGTGGSLYYIRHRDMVEGSEKLRVEVRDRLSHTTISTIYLKEEIDYEVDYITGRIMLKKPLNSIQQAYSGSIVSNDILMGERAYLVVDYEYYDSSMSNQTDGIRVSQQIGSHLRVGGTYVQEAKSGADYKLAGGDATVKLNLDTSVTARYTHTEETQLSASDLSYDGGITFEEQGEDYSLGKDGNAFSIDGQTRLFDNTDIYLSYMKEDPFYSVTNSISSQGTNKYIAKIVSRLTENLSAGISHVTQQYLEHTVAGITAGAKNIHTTTAAIDYAKNKWDLRGEFQHQEADHPFTDFTYMGMLPLLKNDFLAARIGYQLLDWLHPYIRGQATVTGEANNQGTVGTDIRIWEDITLNLAETVGTLGDSTLIGITSTMTEGKDMYANLEVGNDLRLGKYTKTTYGQSANMGVEGKVYTEEDYSSYRENIVRGNLLGYNRKISETIGMGLSYERSNVENNAKVINRDSGSVGLSYLNPDLMSGVKAFTKLELRNDRGTEEERQWFTQNDLLWRITDGFSLTGRGNYGWTEDQDTDQDMAEFYEIGTGFSFRPVSWDKLNLLGKYSYLTDMPPDSQWDFAERIEARKNVYSIEGIYDLCRLIQLVGKFAYRDMKERVGERGWTKSDTYLYIVRSNFHIMNCEEDKPFIMRGWDLGVEYRMLANDSISDSKEGFLVELDKDFGNYVKLGVGYNFTNYDDDLRNDDSYDAEGWFVKLAGKY